MKHLDLFSGIGGFARAADMTWEGIEHTFCEIDPFCQAVLENHWPKSKIYGDIRTLSADSHFKHGQAGENEEKAKRRDKSAFALPIGCNQFDILTGGFPCQPFSQAGRRLGTEDSRHLWPQMLRVIREFHPRWIVGENVGGLVTWSDGMVLEQIHVDLEGEGYEVQAFIIPAVSVNAPHRRDRIWIVAHDAIGSDRGHNGKQEERQEQEYRKRNGNGDASDTEHRSERNEIGGGNEKRPPAGTPGSDTTRANTASKRLERQSRAKTSELKCGKGNENSSWRQPWLEVASELCRVDDGIPRRLDRNSRLKALGNAIVPQVAAQIFQAIKDSDGY